MFNIVKSNKMEHLMAALASVTCQVPDNPMMPEWIGIQSRGMKQWIAVQMAQKLGICTNIRFLYPRQIVDHILTGFELPEEGKGQQESLDEEGLFWAVMKLIREGRSQKELSGLEPYIREDATGKKLYQLSRRLAKVFDDYQVYRPDMLCNWQGQGPHERLKDPVARWQAGIWRQIVSKNPQNHLAGKARRFLDSASLKTAAADFLVPRISLFGISALPDIFLQIFEKVSARMDINLYLLVPSHLFFFDNKSEKQMGKIALKEASGTSPEHLYYETGHPLLSSLGTAGKSFLNSLESINYHEPFDDLFQDPGEDSPTMLSQLQSDILNLVHREEGGQASAVTMDSPDNSIGIHACHSPMRETQVLKDLLLNEFETDPDLFPHDIIVMMPDIEAYAPFIESVFSLETTLPFSISDRRKKSESEPLEAFLKILALKDARLDKSAVLDLLLSESIARKFDIAMDDTARIEKMAADAKILWGRDAGHRERLGLPPFEENTWQFGFQRLFMGMAMPEHHEEITAGISPCDSFEGLDLEVLGKFAAFCHALFSCLDNLEGQKTIDDWCRVLKNTAASLMDRNFENEEDFAFLVRTVEAVKEAAQTAGFDKKIAFDVMGSHIEHMLDQNISQGSFLAGNITFCNIMPMRSIPFKIVILMGMDEKSFPRQAFSPGFNLMKKYPEKGDKNERDEDRYLFLETLLSARSKFMVTYTGMNIQDNSIIPCAGVVSELLDIMAQSFVFRKQAVCHFFHPLHPFNREYFNRDTAFFSFSRDNLNIAKALLNKKPDTKKFIRAPFVNVKTDEPSSLGLEELIRFLRNPVKGFVQEGLKIKLPEIREQTLEREAFSMSGLDQYAMGSFLVEKPPEMFLKKDFYPVFKAMGSLPLGEKGRLEYERIIETAGPLMEAAGKIASRKQLLPLAMEVNVDGFRVSANFSGIREDAHYVLSYGKLTAARLLSVWIRHLFLNIAAPDGYPKKTVLIGRDPLGKTPISICTFPQMESDAPVHFKDLVHIYKKGIKQPFYFFCETSWQFVQAISKETFELTRESVQKAMTHAKTRASWYGGHYQTGEMEDRYISLCARDNDPFESAEALVSSGVARNSVAVYKPLLDNMTIS